VDTPDFEVPVSRRTLVAAAAGGLATAAIAATARPRAALAATDPSGPAVSPFDLHFRTTDRYRPFALIAPGFVQFDTATTEGARIAARPGVDPSGGRVRLAAGDVLVRTGIRPAAPYGTVEVEVGELGAGGAVVAGLAADSSRSILARYDAAAGQVTIEVTVDGRTTVADAVPARLAAPFRFAFVLNERAVTVLVDTTGTGTAWTPLVTERDRVAQLIDPRLPAVLGQLSYAFGGSGAGPVTLGRVRAGYFGEAGLRDPHVVQTADGRPLIRDGKLYLTFTCAGLGFFQQAHWGVWTLHLADPRRLEQVAQIFFQRDGVLVGDHAGQIVYDQRRGRFIALVSSWGTFAFQGVQVRHTTTTANLLRGVHVLPSQPLALPTTVSSWDPALTLIDGRWHVAFVESPRQTPDFVFHPALAVAPPGADYAEGLRLRGADPTVTMTEGCILQRVGGRWYLLASDGVARQYRVYDLDVRFLGTLDAPYGTNIPHPQIVPVPVGPRTEWWMVTFDGTQYAEPVLGYGTHGDVLIMRARQS
jgi:hypothetical protein